MKANILMIGDWVKSFEPIRVEAVYRHSVSDSAMVKHSELDIEPISLTPEILEKNDFMYHDNGMFMPTGFHYYGAKHICYRAETPHVLVDGDCLRASINYVHELQHALRLCGMNELADNFKV